MAKCVVDALRNGDRGEEIDQQSVLAIAHHLLHRRGTRGNDTLTGDLDVADYPHGPDHFIFDATPGSANATDFYSASDKIHLDGRVMPALGPSGNFSSDDVRIYAAAGATGGHDADDRVVYDTSTGNLYYDADGNGSGAAQLIATVQTFGAIASVVATDIVVDNGTTGGTPPPPPPGSIVGMEGNDTLKRYDRQ